MRKTTVALVLLGVWVVGAQSTLASVTQGDLFYTVYSGFNRVKKVSYNFDGSTFSLGTPTVLASGIGADGIAGNPNDANSVLVAGQGSGLLHRVSRSGGGVLQSAGTISNAFHLEVADSSTLYVSGIPGALGRVALNGDGSIGATTSIAVSGSNTDVTQIITTPSGDFYTRSFSGGNGTFGTISFSGTSATTTALLTSLPAAHGGVYDPFTNTIILMGDNHLTQVSLGGVILADLTISGARFDQGTVDGKGHLFAASNTGGLMFMDYAAATGGLIDDAGNFSSMLFLEDYLDDIAPLVGAGTTDPVIPEPSTLVIWSLLAVLGIAT
ncbi:MAG: hypothetical protein V3R99_03145, partial [Thermoguttaceae bacterium]